MPQPRNWLLLVADDIGQQLDARELRIVFDAVRRHCPFKQDVAYVETGGECIPANWMKGYVDRLLEFAARFGTDSAMGQAQALRAEHAMDLVEAWRAEKR